MQLSETVKLYPTEYQIELIRNTMSEYISTVNNIVYDYQCIRDAKSIVKKYDKACKEVEKAKKNKKNKRSKRSKKVKGNKSSCFEEIMLLYQ